MKNITRYNQEHFRFILFFMVATASIVGSCKKLVEVNPPDTSINSGNVYANDATAIAAVTEIYASISRADIQSGGIASLNLFPSLSSDELSLYSAVTNSSANYYYKNAISSINLNNHDFWTDFYKTISITNAAMEGLSTSTKLTGAVKNQLLGEVKFMRAFCYFYLVNLYGDAPLILTTDYKANSVVKRTPKADVYRQVVTDLKDAQSLLSSNYLDASLLDATIEKLRPTKWAATALLARVYLYNSDYSNTLTESSKIINSGVFSLPVLSEVFKMNSAEAIWQLQPVNGGWNTEDAKAFILPSNGPDATSHPFYLSNQLLNSFEANDQREANWINKLTVGSDTFYYPYKYKNATYNSAVTEYEMVFRLAEQYLIRAEAEAQLNQFKESRNDLNAIRTRAALLGTSANDKNSLLTAILHERQVELFTEWGHRWFDLKRTGNIDVVMSVVTLLKGGTWNTNWQWYPISRIELELNNKLTQNEGY